MQKFNPYRQAAGDSKRIWSQVRTETATIAIEQRCQGCGKTVTVQQYTPNCRCEQCQSVRKEPQS